MRDGWLFCGVALLTTATLIGCGSKTAEPSAPTADKGGDTQVVVESPEPDPSDAPDAANEHVKTMFVHGHRAECEGGEGPRKCLQVRFSESEAWQLFYSPIQGFSYEESYAYELRVEVATDPKPPADGSSLRYRLLEVVSKQKVP